MSQRTTTAVVLIGATLALGFWVHHYFSPGEVVRRRLMGAVEAIEDERLLGVMSAVSRTYSDPWGFDYETIGGTLNRMMADFDELEVDLQVGEIAVSDGVVRIGLEFVVTGRADGARELIVGSGRDPCTAVIVWHEEAPGWRLASTADLDIPELRGELEERRAR